MKKQNTKINSWPDIYKKQFCHINTEKDEIETVMISQSLNEILNSKFNKKFGTLALFEIGSISRNKQFQTKVDL